MNPIGSRSRSATGVTEALALLNTGDSRLVSIFGSIEDDGTRRVHYIIDVENRGYRLLSERVAGAIPSATRITPAASWYERELHDLYGVEIEGHPNLQPLVFHEDWPAEIHPHASAPGMRDAPQGQYRFLKVQGEGVCEVPVGPVHAGIIEPGHFRFSVVGDTVLHLELRHFYTHKGTEALFEGTPVMSGVMLAESVSGDNCFAHAVAYCQAVENAFGISVPPRGRALRLIGLELERMLAHIADVGALCGDVAFVVPASYTARLKELLLQSSARFFGTRCWRGLALPGGMKHDLTQENARALGAIVAEVARDFAELARMILETPSVQNRFESTGTLKRDLARALGLVGPAARASGLKLDVRHDHPYGRYRTLALDIPHYNSGDVLARARIRIDETAIAARLIAQAVEDLPAGAIATSVPWQGSAEGFSAVESPRGELLYWIRVRDGYLRRCHIKSPSFQNWPALPMAMPGNIIADFPLINKSFNLSYSGCDR
ncbi:MAG: NADH-quinone oxidoreductase subunit C [Candidatus Korobacteraceae bacterium]|jgi:Ni,Fe-hydrogenase III large subunit